jgi:hypothetical protein
MRYLSIRHQSCSKSQSKQTSHILPDCYIAFHAPPLPTLQHHLLSGNSLQAGSHLLGLLAGLLYASCWLVEWLPHPRQGSLTHWGVPQEWQAKGVLSPGSPLAIQQASLWRPTSTVYGGLPANKQTPSLALGYPWKTLRTSVFLQVTGHGGGFQISAAAWRWGAPVASLMHRASSSLTSTLASSLSFHLLSALWLPGPTCLHICSISSPQLLLAVMLFPCSGVKQSYTWTMSMKPIPA